MGRIMLEYRAAKGRINPSAPEIANIVAMKTRTTTKSRPRATDYMETEYGLSPKEADRAAARILAESALSHRRGEYVEVTGNFADLIAVRRKHKSN